MQTRRSLALTTKSPSILKPTLTSVFKHSKARASARTLTSKATAQLVQTTKVIETETSTLSIENDTPTSNKKTRQPRKTTPSQTPMEIETTITTTTETILTKSTKKSTTTKESKPKTPEENPWTKRPMYIPSYAQEALDHLRKVDPALAPLIANHPYTIYNDDDINYFRILSRTIIGQQIHWKAAKSIIFNFVSYYYPDGKVTVESLDSGDLTFPTPTQVLSTSMESLRRCGLSERKVSYIQDLARHFVEGKITFTDMALLKSMKDEEIASQLLCVKGIGPWTVDMFMMSTLERLDILPTLDLGVRRGMEKHFKHEYKNGVWGEIIEETIVDGDGDIKKVIKKKNGKGKAKNGEMTCADMEKMAERWRPYRSIASWYMWRNADIVTAPI